MGFSRPAAHALLALIAIAIAGARVGAQTPSPSAGAIEGTVSTQAGTIKLPGVTLTVHGPSDAVVSEQVSDEDGHVRIADLPPGKYRVEGSLDGFQSTDTVVSVEAGATATVSLDLPIAAVSEHVDVVASPVVASAGTLAATDTVEKKEVELIAPGETVQSALRLLASVIQLPHGASVSGGRPNQIGFRLEGSSLIDPTTNAAHLTLPVAAVESFSVLPNPYEVEFGRFGTGVVVVDTRRAGEHWKTELDNVEPAFRLKRFTLFDIKGISVLKPSVETGGPLRGNRVFLEQTAQYHFDTIDVPSLPESERRTTQWFSEFSRVDAKVSAKHSLIMSGGVFPSGVHQATLGTFTPPASSADISDRAEYASVTDRAILSARTFVESTLQFHEYDTDVLAQPGSGAMTLLPETTTGPFFNHQHRESGALQWLETVSATRSGRGGQHFVKAGLDVFYGGYDGTSTSAPVLIDRANGTLARALDFGASTTQSVRSVDAAAFIEDRVQPSARWYLEIGARIDHDGILSDETMSPRAGVAVLLNAAGTAVLRGGYGWFYERTPSIAEAFDQFEAATDTRYALDGVTPLGPPVQYRHVVGPDLHAAHSATWDVEYDHRLSHGLAVHLGWLDRQGSDELIVEPETTAEGAEMLLNDSGRSSYRQADVGVRLTHGSRLDINASYVRSAAREDLNALVNFYDIVLVPVIGVNGYAPAAADAPNRVFVRGRAMPTRHWMVLGTLDWRSGLPYSVVNETLDFVGVRNDRRFPTYARVEMGIDRQLSVAKVHPWLGLRVTNALNAFLPADVVANLGSPAFGSFANSEYRQYRVHLRFER